MPTPSHARDFFDKITSAPDPVAAIIALASPEVRESETDWLEFKVEHPTDEKVRAKTNKSYWSEDLSAFANNQGGVMIWGLGTDKVKVDGGYLDVANEVKPIANVVAMAARLVELQRQATDPPLSNVEVKHFMCPDSTGAGFVICYIPEGPHKPYRSEMTHDKQYYLRAGSSSFVMSPSVLRSMFYPKASATFVVNILLSSEPYGGPSSAYGTDYDRNRKLVCQVILTNVGNATAKDVFVGFATRVPGNYVPPSVNQPITTTTNGGFEASVIRSVHPSRSERLPEIGWVFTPQIIQSFRFKSWPKGVLQFTVSCENQQQQLFECVFNLEQSLLDRQSELTALPVEYFA